MSSLREIQQDFINFLQNNTDTMAQHVADQGDLSRETRLGIYANAYRLRLKQVVETDHPVLGSYLGDDLFDQMFADYLQQHPSTYTSLRHYCDQLPGFLQQTPPFCEHPILAELAQFERILMLAFDAPDTQRLTAEDLHTLDPQLWPQMKLRFHPSMQFFAENWNTVTSWQAMKAGNPPPDASPHPDVATWILWRNHELLTQFTSLSVDEHCMFSQYLAGKDFSDVCEGLLEWHNEQQVPVFAVQTLQKWLQQGLVQQIVTDS